MQEKIARRLSKRMPQLERAAAHFVFGQSYTEPQVNEILEALVDDHVFARRLLIEWGFLDRENDGSAYWRMERKAS
jgi:hypothetical protein